MTRLVLMTLAMVSCPGKAPEPVCDDVFGLDVFECGDVIEQCEDDQGRCWLGTYEGPRWDWSCGDDEGEAWAWERVLFYCQW